LNTEVNYIFANGRWDDHIYFGRADKFSNIPDADWLAQYDVSSRLESQPFFVST